jgi:hypothetical protein
MAQYQVFPDGEDVLDLIERLRRHHDHLKALDDCYTYMRQKETYERMRDPDFRCDPKKMRKVNSSHFTSLIIKLLAQQGKQFFSRVNGAYQELKNLVRHFNPEANVEIYFDSAHITIKSLLDGVQQDEAALKAYLPVISPIVHKWIGLMGPETKLYGVGLFTNLHEAKGLSVGVRFYPSLPLIQIIRGEVGAALYGTEHDLQLRAETALHTMLTHSTGFRAREVSFPLPAEFVTQFQVTVEKFDQRVFGVITDIRSDDVYVRNGYSNKLVSVAEVSV